MTIIEAEKWQFGRMLLLAVFLLAGLFVTGWAALRIKGQVDENAKREFDFVCSEIYDKISERFLAHAQLLRSGESFWAASDEVSRQKWQSFCAHQGLDQYLHGIQGLGFALLIPREKFAQHIQEIRAEGFREYQVRPEGERALYSAIIYLEPFTTRNLQAFGYDMLSEPIRRAAMERARDLNEAVLSGKVRLVQETTNDVQAGTLMYLPVYHKNMPIENVDQRRAAIMGWVYSPYRMTDLMEGILGIADLKNTRRIRLEVFDGELATPAALLYDSQPTAVHPADVEAQLNSQLRLVVTGCPWTLRFTSTDRPATYSVVWLVIWGGTTISLLLAGFIFSLLNTEFKARHLARQLTQDLRSLNTMLEQRIEERTADLAVSHREALNMMNEAITARGLVEEANQRLNQKMNELQKVSQELKKSEIRFRNYFNLPMHGRAITSLEKGWVEVNDRLCTMLGYSRNEITKMSWSEMSHPDDLSADIEQFKRMISGQIEQYQIEKRFVRKDGTVVWINLAAGCVRKPDGQVDYLTAVLEDITDHKKMESEKLKLEELSRQINKEKTLGRMAGAIAHHFNNQMHVVMGYLNMVIDGLPPGDSRVTDLATAMQAAKKASDVSSLMITYLGQKQVKLEAVDIAEQVIVTLPVFLEGKPPNVNVEHDAPSPGPVIKADVKQIQQILTILVTNAFESIRDRAGTVHLSVKTVSSTDIPPSHRFPVDWTVNDHSYACLKVMDSGCGIQPTDFDNLFEPFFSTKSVGRGLGLPVVLGIVRAHKGGVTVDDRNGGGSVFSVFFPLSAQTEPQQMGHVVMGGPGSGGTVLLVEDDDLVRDMTSRQLRRQGYTVLQAQDGIEAVEIFRQHKDEISCLLSDLIMPRMDGWATIAALRAIRHDLPVVLASGYDEASVMAGEHAELPELFLSKPYNFHELDERIGCAIARRKARV